MLQGQRGYKKRGKENKVSSWSWTPLTFKPLCDCEASNFFLCTQRTQSIICFCLLLQNKYHFINHNIYNIFVRVHLLQTVPTLGNTQGGYTKMSRWVWNPPYSSMRHGLTDHQQHYFFLFVLVFYIRLRYNIAFTSFWLIPI